MGYPSSFTLARGGACYKGPLQPCSQLGTVGEDVPKMNTNPVRGDTKGSI